MIGKYRLTTLGCKVNQYESQQIREALESLGLHAAGRSETPDLAVVNTCAVTVAAARKSRQFIRRASQGGKVPTVVVGCYATAAADVLSGIGGVVAVAGHDGDICTAVRDIASRRLESGTDRRQRSNGAAATAPYDGRPPAGRDILGDDVAANTTARLQDPSAVRRAGHPPAASNSIPLSEVDVNGGAADRIIHAFAGHQRAFLKVQDGCDAFCTYCIIPRLRPRLSSKPIKTAVEEARGLVRAGHREIVVTGIYLGAYGRETAVRRRFTHGRAPLADLVEALASVKGLERLRLSSLEPGDVDARLLSVLRHHGCCVPHLHLPLQAGSDAVLRRMNRQYTAGDYLEMIARVRDALDRPAISTDIVVGFCGETEADFERMLEIARQVGFCKIHAFPFSPRPETAAAKWTDEFVDSGVVKQRMKRLARTERETAGRFVRGFVGCTERVIVERSQREAEATVRRPNGSLRHGRTDRYFEVCFDGPDVTAGDVVEVRIDRVTPRRVHGTLMKVL